MRRRSGMFYTDPQIVRPMVDWILKQAPERVVDAGCGSGRFGFAVVTLRPRLPLVAVDVDPVATLICRANLSVAGATAARVLNEDFTTLKLSAIGERTAYVGNPPYVRHHELTPAQKQWLVETSSRLGHKISKLAGLHAHFFFATAAAGSTGDVGCYVTSSEWLYTNYGASLRRLLLDGLGMRSLHAFEQTATPFADAMTTAAITCFELGRPVDSAKLRTVRAASYLQDLDKGHLVKATHLARARTWGDSLAASPIGSRSGLMTLGDVARVHRGAVTGGNRYFVMSRREAEERGLAKYVRPVLASADEVFKSDGVLMASSAEKVVLAPPRSVDLNLEDSEPLRRYLHEGERLGVPSGYVCSHRNPWWFIAFKEPPPIVATYMARQQPMFAANPDGVLILNVLHGVYPRQRLSSLEVRKLVSALNSSRETFRGHGRFYQGGLQKLEPHEMEGLPLPQYA